MPPNSPTPDANDVEYFGLSTLNRVSVNNSDILFWSGPNDTDGTSELLDTNYDGYIHRIDKGFVATEKGSLVLIDNEFKIEKRIRLNTISKDVIGLPILN
ncbi:hypothetical protein CCASP_00765 [Corynebacterium caspium DSM 44850]|nr:hypothetical protein CCASP_00765 [Corynebacterium caspium DSM 44850]